MIEQLFGVALAFFLGLLIGSFLNVCIDRLPRGESVVAPRSHCGGCGRTLAYQDMVPVLSFVALGGRCRYCGTRIPPYTPVVEGASGALFAAIWILRGPSPEFFAYAVYASIFLALSVIDLQHKRILNVIVYPTTAFALVSSVFLVRLGLSSALLGGAASALLFFVPALLWRNSMGGGDVKLAGAIGAMVGFPTVAVSLLSTVIVGGLVSAILLALGRVGRKDVIPFGPFLCFGGLVGLLYGDQLLRMYLGIFVR